MPSTPLEVRLGARCTFQTCVSSLQGEGFGFDSTLTVSCSNPTIPSVLWSKCVERADTPTDLSTDLREKERDREVHSRQTKTSHNLIDLTNPTLHHLLFQ